MNVDEWIAQQDDPDKWRHIYVLIKSRWEEARRRDPSLTMREFFDDFLEAVDEYIALKGKRQ